jgi:hypothetical protein
LGIGFGKYHREDTGTDLVGTVVFLFNDPGGQQLQVEDRPVALSDTNLTNFSITDDCLQVSRSAM